MIKSVEREWTFAFIPPKADWGGEFEHVKVRAKTRRKALRLAKEELARRMGALS